MTIYPPPLKDILVPISSNWRSWFDLVSTAIIKLGGLKRIYDITATLDFPAVAAHSEAILAVTVPGVVFDNLVNPSRIIIGASPVTGIIYEGYISADNEVTIRCINVTAGAINPGSRIYSISVLSYT